VYSAMALCKAMILVGALLLVTTLPKRVKQVSDVTPHQPEKMMQQMGDGTMKKTMDEMREQGQEELGEALVEEDMSKRLTGTAGEDAEEEAEPMMAPEPKAEAATSRTLKLIRQGKQKEGIAKRGKGKDFGKDKGVDAVKEKENKLSKGFEVNTKAKGTIVRKLEERPERQMRFPVSTLTGRWWIIKLAFMRGQFAGFIHQEIAATKTLLIKSWKAQEDFGDEVILPLWSNYIGAKVGDKITFDIGALAQEGEGKPRPMATNVIIREREQAVEPHAPGIIMAPPHTDVRTQILYYMSDSNLRTDKFFQDIIAATKGGWISLDFLLLCKRLKQLGASKKSIIEALQDTPGLEVRDTPGQEAIRRTRRPPALEPGTLARKEVEFPALEDPWAGKKTYSLEAMRSMRSDLSAQNAIKMLGQDREELAKIAGPEGNKQKRLLAVAEAVDPEAPERKARADSKKIRRAEDKARADSKKEEMSKERAKKAAVDKAAAKKAAAEKPAAKKALAVEVGQAAAKNPEAEKAAAFAKRRLLEQAAADKAVTEQTAVEKAAEEPAAVPAATSDDRKSWASWFSTRPRAAWGYLAGKPETEEKNEGEQNADDLKGQQQGTQEKNELISE